MSFTCNDCGKNIQTVADVRNCSRCQSSGRASRIGRHYSSTDFITPMMIGMIIGAADSPAHSHQPQEDTPAPAPVIEDTPSYSAPSPDSPYSSDSGSSFSGGGEGGGSL